ncbi:MAG: DUF427 domain-containing protein [Myxococcales bacterium]
MNERTDQAQESIWEYPRRPSVEPSHRHVLVAFEGVELAATYRARRVLEFGRPPVYYIPRADVRMDHLRLTERRTWCVCRGVARYYDVVVGDKVAAQAAWSYPHPTPLLHEVKGYIAFYPDRVDACFVDGERVRAVEGSYFGGWITQEVAGPFDFEPPTEDVEL